MKVLGSFIPNAAMTPEQQWVLGNYLLIYGWIQQGIMATFTDSRGEAYSFSVPYSIYSWKSLSHPNDNRYVIVKDKLGAGSMGVVYACLGTLKPRTDHSVEFKIEPVRVIKIENIYEKSTAQSVELSKQATYLHAKHNQFNNKQMTIMHHLQGRTLTNIVTKTVYPNINGVRLFIHLLQACEDQLHANGIIHLDIKPDNVMLLTSDDMSRLSNIDIAYATIFYFDFSHSIPLYKSHHKSISGANYYAAPEQLLDSALTTATDVYGIARVAANIFDLLDEDERALVKQRKDSKETYTREDATSIAHRVVKYVPRRSHWSLSDAHKNKIIELLEKMSSYFFLERPAISTALTMLWTIIFEAHVQMLANYQIDHDPINLRAAMTTALRMRTELAAKARRRVEASSTKPVDLADLRQTIQQHLHSFTENISAVKYFVNVLGLIEFYGLDSSITLLKRVDDIQANVNKALKKEGLLAILDKLVLIGNDTLIESVKANRLLLMQDIGRYLQKTHQVDYSLSGMQALIEKISKRTFFYALRFEALMLQQAHAVQYPILLKISQGMCGDLSNTKLLPDITQLCMLIEKAIQFWQVTTVYDKALLGILENANYGVREICNSLPLVVREEASFEPSPELLKRLNVDRQTFGLFAPNSSQANANARPPLTQEGKRGLTRSGM